MPLDHQRFVQGVGRVSCLGVDEVLALTERFHRFGFVILRPHTCVEPRRDLLALARIFGSVVDHVLADADGVVVIEPRAEFARFGHAFTCARMEIHTDGAFTPVPPNVVAMQCETAPASGGSTCLVDGEALYGHLRRVHGGDCDALFATDAITVRRAGECASQPIFALDGDRARICFRLDDSVEVSFRPDVERFVAAIRSYLDNPANQTQVHLAAGDILVLDNRRILHGREAFSASDERRMHRIWFDGRSEHCLQLGFPVAEPGPDRRPSAFPVVRD